MMLPHADVRLYPNRKTKFDTKETIFKHTCTTLWSELGGENELVLEHKMPVIAV